MDQYLVIHLKKVCNLTQAQSGTLILESYNNSQFVIHRKFEDVRKWATDKANLTATQGGCSNGNRKIKLF